MKYDEKTKQIIIEALEDGINNRWEKIYEAKTIDKMVEADSAIGCELCNMFFARYNNCILYTTGCCCKEYEDWAKIVQENVTENVANFKRAKTLTKKMIERLQCELKTLREE